MEGRPLRMKRNERASTIFYDGLTYSSISGSLEKNRLLF